MLDAPDRAVVPSTSAPSISLADPSLYINRELSWIAFNRRVLAQAEDPGHPLLERVRFLSIVATNLDEFFMIRVAALLRKIRSGVEDMSPDGLSTAEQLARVRAESADVLAQQAACWTLATSRVVPGGASSRGSPTRKTLVSGPSACVRAAAW